MHMDEKSETEIKYSLILDAKIKFEIGEL